jgi:hypothetical protein
MEFDRNHAVSIPTVRMYDPVCDDQIASRRHQQGEGVFADGL